MAPWSLFRHLPPIHPRQQELCQGEQSEVLQTDGARRLKCSLNLCGVCKCSQLAFHRPTPPPLYNDAAVLNPPQAMRLFVGEPVWTPLNRPQVRHLGWFRLFSPPSCRLHLDAAHIFELHIALHGAERMQCAKAIFPTLQDDHPSRGKYIHDFTKATGNLSEAVGA